MKKSFIKISAILLTLVCLFSFTGCNKNREIIRISKNLNKYEIIASLNEEDMTVQINEKVIYTNRHETPLDNVCFNIYSRGFREDAEIKPYTLQNEGKVFPNGISYGDGQITGVKVNGEKKKFTFVGEADAGISIKFDKPLDHGDKAEIEIDMTVTLANCTHRLGYMNGSVNLGNAFPLLAVYENGEYQVYPYYSTGDPFYSEMANFTVNFSYPSEYNLVSTGEILSQNMTGSVKNAKIDAKAVRDFAITLTKNAKTVSKTVGQTKISYTGYEGDEDLDENLATAIKAYNYYSKVFGAYPYTTLSVVKTPFVHGGMEYPNMVTIADSIVTGFEKARVIAHEIAHQWWYGMVGNDEVKQAWLDEALAEYSSILFFEAHGEYGVSYEELISEAFSIYTLYADIVKASDKNINTEMILPVYEYTNEYEYSYMIYVKGSLMFDSIRNAIGKEKLMKCFKEYFRDYKYKISKTDALIASFAKTSRRNIEGVFDSYLSGSTVIGTI